MTDGISVEESRERKHAALEVNKGPITKEMIQGCLSYWPEDEVIAEKLLDEIDKLKDRVTELEKGGSNFGHDKHIELEADTSEPEDRGKLYDVPDFDFSRYSYPKVLKSFIKYCRRFGENK